MRTRIGILVVDRKESLIIESIDDTKDNSYAASGLAAYSNSKPITLSYASIFETLWKQAELYEELKIHSRMQKEFIDVAAHELTYSYTTDTGFNRDSSQQNERR